MQLMRLSDRSWDGADESASNPLQATVTKDSAKRETIKIKYRGQVLKELRVWVVWATISTTDIPISTIANAVTGNPTGPALGLQGGYNFTYTIAPGTIVSDSNRPNFSGANTTAPPGGNHPINGNPLSSGADKKWDGSRRIRFKTLNPNNIHVNDTAFAAFGVIPDLLNFPANDAEGNDDRSVGDETNDPYANGGQLTGQDIPKFALAHRGGVNGDSYELRFQFQEFARLEIEGTWYRISDYYPWRFHFGFYKNATVWLDNGSTKALDNSGF